MLKRLFVVFSLVLCTFANAQEALNLFGNSDQPGNRLHVKISESIDQGVTAAEAIESNINLSLEQDATVLNGESKSAVAFDLPLANQFYDEMVLANSLIEVTKVLSEENPEKTVHVITLATVLYPDFAQEVFDGAALAGVMSPEDILIAVLQAGADPTTVSDATAAGATGAGAVAVTPLGPGVGAGGTGGGDTTASTN